MLMSAKCFHSVWTIHWNVILHKQVLNVSPTGQWASRWHHDLVNNRFICIIKEGALPNIDPVNPWILFHAYETTPPEKFSLIGTVCNYLCQIFLSFSKWAPFSKNKMLIFRHFVFNERNIILQPIRISTQSSICLLPPTAVDKFGLVFILFLKRYVMHINYIMEK